MKAALINRWHDLRALISTNPQPAGWTAGLMDMWRIEAILEDRYQYDISLTGAITI